MEDVGYAELVFQLHEPAVAELVAEGEVEAGVDVAHGEARGAGGGVGVDLAAVEVDALGGAGVEHEVDVWAEGAVEVALAPGGAVAHGDAHVGAEGEDVAMVVGVAQQGLFHGELAVELQGPLGGDVVVEEEAEAEAGGGERVEHGVGNQRVAQQGVHPHDVRRGVGSHGEAPRGILLVALLVILGMESGN